MSSSDDEVATQADLNQVVEGIPAWIYSPRSTIIGIVVTWFVASILDLWGNILGFVQMVLFSIARTPAVVADVVAGGLSPLWLVFDGIEAVSLWVESFALSMGLFAPLAVLMAWVVPVLLLSALFWFLVGFVDTYVPLSALPVLGRFFDR